jgi:hypothetical protein
MGQLKHGHAHRPASLRCRKTLQVAGALIMNERQQILDDIKQQITKHGFTPKDFFLTQVLPPDGKDKGAYENWKRREARRRPIVRRLYRHGFTAHDLIPSQVSNVTLPRG